jgi:ribosomal protein L7/L12
VANIPNSCIVAMVKHVVATLPGQKIEQIKTVRLYTGFGLKLSKELVEMADQPPRCPVLTLLEHEEAYRGPFYQ